MVDDNTPTTAEVELIKRRRNQVLVHSCIYYQYDESYISDHQFDAWCIELVELIKRFPDAYSDNYDKYFKDWRGESGYQFPHRDNIINGRAIRIMRIMNKGLYM